MTRHGRTCRWLLYPSLAALAIIAFEGVHETVATRFPGQPDHAPGRLVDVGGRRLHLLCSGSGAPTVILESGLGETAAYWKWISRAVARDTRVCAYDRAGRGWSDAAPTMQDGVGVATDLHALLRGAGVDGPLILVGHSSGAQYIRIFAGRYPEQVAGMVLLDGQPAEAFERLPNFPVFYHTLRRVSAVLPSRFFRSFREEFAALPASLRQARSVQTLGDLPLAVVTASRDAQTGWLPLQVELAALSTNSSHRLVPYTHAEVVTDPVAADVSSDAIRDVVRAVKFGGRLNERS